MSLKELQNNIDSQTVKRFQKSLNKKEDRLFDDENLLNELFRLKDSLSKIEDKVIQTRSTAAADQLSNMTEEERRMLSMSPDEFFFIEYRRKNPDNKWTYFKAYQKKLEKEYKEKNKE